MYDNSKPLEERFWDRVDVGGPEECWEWKAGRFTQGYGAIQDLELQKKLYAHRLSYTINVGEIPEGMHVMHSCDNPPCCNPAHLSVGTAKTNSDDKIKKGRGSGKKLTVDDVRAIKVLALTGKTYDELAEEFSVHRYTIYRILAGRIWAGVS